MKKCHILLDFWYIYKKHAYIFQDTREAAGVATMGLDRNHLYRSVVYFCAYMRLKCGEVNIFFARASSSYVKP